MDNSQLTVLAALVISFASTVISAACLLLVFKARAQAHDLQLVVARLEQELAAAMQHFDNHAERTGANARRIAWLESRVRNSNPTTEPEPVVNEESKSTMSDRRRRVMKLRERGQDSRTIAATLNMPHGEVELIIGLTS